MKPQFHLPLSTYPDASSFTIVDNAIDLARQIGADLLASIPQVRVPPIHPRFPTVVDVDSWRAQAEGYSRDSGASLREHIADAVSQSSVEVRIHGFDAREPFVFESFARIARSHDLSIVEASELSRQLSETLLLESGRPLILFPASRVCGRVDTIAIAWDGSATAARAISCARIFAERLTKMQVISVIDDKQIDEANRSLLIASLRHSGFEVEDVSIEAGGGSPAAALQAAALERKADLLVAGGFGHSRLREFILGGVTREFLCKADMPVLLAH
ncbi:MULTISPECIES: universal stress protein [unclassified Rhizobium]|uniref:universal stress protein n=1 Tax=unclassified Rhizobium TaxID=2613769 RepID=UPI0007EBF53E|nr:MULTISPECIES: universal stress protein [unclassified Rhizobium]ANM13361.1 universal stress UspA-like protein [Rhizobium sp. N324]ANM19761.1 universal stress UspA-like protein [Rhizobium sp. N541]ANM26146.1 universal stress UspA-like protein [Rhizobium sp. N941]OYD01151.1 universal stress UspA-like protein [Rhizobium sp. N4311]